jgi:hypothetical protein
MLHRNKLVLICKDSIAHSLLARLDSPKMGNADLGAMRLECLLVAGSG